MRLEFAGAESSDGALGLLSSGNAEPGAVATVVRRRAAAAGGSGVLRPDEPGAATMDTGVAGIRAGWVICGRYGEVVRAVPIGAPLPGISVHVVKPEGVGLEGAGRRGEREAIAGFDP